MPDRDPAAQAIERYLDDCLIWAGLARDDRKRVRAELKDHLATLITSQPAENAPAKNSEEVLAMLREQFGDERKLGEEIARAKGRFRTYLKKQRRRLPISIAVALVLFFSIRVAVAQAFIVPSDAAAPAVPKGSRVLVYKWATNFRGGDIMVFRDGKGGYMIGTLRDVETAADTVVLARNGHPDRVVSRGDIVGRVVLNTR